MKLKDILEYIDSLQDIQIINARTGKALTSVCYLNDNEFSEQVNLYKDCKVYGIASDKCDDGESFLVITIIKEKQ